MILDSTPYPVQAYKSCLGILGSDKKKAETGLSVRSAVQDYNTYSYTGIDRMLKSGMDFLPLDTEKQPQTDMTQSIASNQMSKMKLNGMMEAY